MFPPKAHPAKTPAMSTSPQTTTVSSGSIAPAMERRWKDSGRMSHGPPDTWTSCPVAGVHVLPGSLTATGGHLGAGHPLIFSGGAVFQARARLAPFLKATGSSRHLKMTSTAWGYEAGDAGGVDRVLHSTSVLCSSAVHVGGGEGPRLRKQQSPSTSGIWRAGRSAPTSHSPPPCA
jgi:hypothetical protein